MIPAGNNTEIPVLSNWVTPPTFTGEHKKRQPLDCLSFDIIFF